VEEPEEIDDPQAGTEEQASEAVEAPVVASDVSQVSHSNEDQDSGEDESKEGDE